MRWVLNDHDSCDRERAAWAPPSWLFGPVWTLLYLTIDILLLWLAIGWTVWTFRQIRPAAAALLLPYWAWVTFAAALNASIWYLNR